MNTAQMPPSPEYDDLESIPEFVEQLFREPTLAGMHAPLLKSNLLETWQSYWLQVAAPGVDPRTLRVQAAGRRVLVSGRFNFQVIETATSIRQELPSGELNDTFELPDEVDGQGAEAHFDGGILTVRLPKLAHITASVIPVHCP